MCGSFSDDISDNEDTSDDYVCIGSRDKHGMNILIFDKHGNKIYTICKRGNHITSLYGWVSGIGLLEKIHPHRTEYWINDKYYGDKLDDHIKKRIERNTDIILKQKMSKPLYRFIRDCDKGDIRRIESMDIKPHEIDNLSYH